ncbi:bifunctional nuclease family protein [Flavobacteriales bacterium]|nr:bifunctional nuclease family protein [Flavobacteriales bacterium]
MDLIKLNIIGLSYSQFKSGAYALFLEENNGLRKLSIVIGTCEAQAIAIGLDKNIVSPRPLTHDLFVSISKNTDIVLEKMTIHKLEKGIFFSSISFYNHKTKRSFNIDARTSDAIAIAIRFNAPIYTYKSILDTANNFLDKKVDEHKITKVKSYKKDQQEQSNKLIKPTKKKLEELLDQAIQKEDYETAAKIRDQIKRLYD